MAADWGLCSRRNVNPGCELVKITNVALSAVEKLSEKSFF